MSSRLIPPKVGSRLATISTSLSGSLSSTSMSNTSTGELLEQAALAFHHRLAGERPDIAEAEYGRAVGDYRNQVGARRQRGRFLRVVPDGEARVGDAGRIGEREVALIHQAFGRRDGDFSRRRHAMIFQCVATQLFLHHVLLPLSLSSRS